MGDLPKRQKKTIASADALAKFFLLVPNGKEAINKWKNAQKDQQAFQLSDPTDHYLGKLDPVLPVGTERYKLGVKYYSVNHLEEPPSLSSNLKRTPTLIHPPGWRRFVVQEGANPMSHRRLYYFHRSSQTFQWQNPQLLLPKLFTITADITNLPFPKGWTKKTVLHPTIPNGTLIYFVNSNSKLVQVNDPRLFEIKQRLFRNFTYRNIQKNYQDLFLDTNQYLNCLYGQLASWSTVELHPHTERISAEHGAFGLTTKLGGAQVMGQDAGGVSRTAFTQLTQEWLSPELAMFQEVPYHMVEINPISGAVVQDPNEAWNVLGSLKHFYIFGRFLGLTLWLGHLLGVHLGSTILGPLRGPAHFPGLSFEHFKHLTDRTEVLNEKIDNDSTYSVLERIFSELEKACKQSGTSKEALQKIKSDFLLGNNAPCELYYRAPGVYYEYTLQTADEDPETLSEVQRALKLDAIRKECSDFLGKTSFLPQANAIRNGFKDVLPLEWLRLFTEDELRLLLGGETIIDPAEFAQTVRIAQVSDECLINCDITELDWQHFGADFLETLVEEVTDDASFGKRFLVSLTGRTVPPPGGLAAISPPITVSTTPFNLHAYSCTHSLYLPELFIRLYFEGSMTMNDIFKDIKKLGTEFTIA